MSTRKLAADAFVSLLLSLGTYLVLAGLLSWFYYDGFLSMPGMQFDPSRFAWVARFWVSLAWFLPFLCLWWLVVHFAELARQAEGHRRVAPADFCLFLAGLTWAMLNFAAAMQWLPIEYFSCGDISGFMGTCGGPKRSLFWGITALAGAIFLFGLVARARRWQARDAQPGSDR